ncbi:hypothetical protein FACS189432_00330 [Bacteroidia bacterium]|nr:hypothetical protein FACS189426_01870 [Bacteroidia bacterium]GHT26265.1 hypothetical protein FACS189432_00330 [Bacteroidia bacterium]
MNTNKNISDKQLRKVFKETTLAVPSSGFMENLMLRIEKEAVKEKKKRSWMVYGQIAAGVSGMILLPALTLYLCSLFVPGFSFSFSFPVINLNFDTNLIVIGIAVLFLLMADTLFRKHKHSKKATFDI